MINSRLYYDIQELPDGVLRFQYYTDEINANSADLKSYTKKLTQQEVLSAQYNHGNKNILYNINEMEFSRLLVGVEKHKDYIYNLSRTDPFAANIAINKLWGPNELQRKFIEWFENNGFSIPKK
jgi:hypothetical protein